MTDVGESTSSNGAYNAGHTSAIERDISSPTQWTPKSCKQRHHRFPSTRPIACSDSAITHLRDDPMINLLAKPPVPPRCLLRGLEKSLQTTPSFLEPGPLGRRTRGMTPHCPGETVRAGAAPPPSMLGPFVMSTPLSRYSAPKRRTGRFEIEKLLDGARGQEVVKRRGQHSAPT
jgi:hypothetical protein